ncbi:hypothetical protein PspLS_07083 [Pyricularia sp. CBS 133598]|nr:hypothetical protein PspLS_07083 [Pyricularia sp. CBS 133598]
MQFPIFFAMTMALSLCQATASGTNEVDNEPLVGRDIADVWLTRVKRDEPVTGDDEPDVLPRGRSPKAGVGCTVKGESGLCVEGACRRLIKNPAGRQKTPPVIGPC